MAIDPDIKPLLKKITDRLDALESVAPVDLSPLSARLASLELWRGEHTDTVTVPKEPQPLTLPAGYRRVRDHSIDMARGYDWTRFEIYLPAWEQGPMSMGDPSLITWNADGSATLDARNAAGVWRTGALQLVRPKKGSGRSGAIVHATDPNAVCAFFGYDSKGKEVDFELTWREGSAGWAPAVHMPRAAGGMSHSSKRVMKRAPLSNAAQLLEYDLQADRCDFYCDGVCFETIRPADMDDPAAWDTTTPLGLHCAVEKHSGWAGWSYSSGRAQMVVHAFKS